MNIQTIKYIGRGVTLALVIIIVFGYYTVSQCVNTVIMEEPSPDGSWKMVLFERSCGSSGKSSQVSILKSDQPIENFGGNVYIAEGYPEGYSIEWLTNQSVKISGVKGTNHLMEKGFEGISIQYE